MIFREFRARSVVSGQETLLFPVERLLLLIKENRENMKSLEPEINHPKTTTSDAVFGVSYTA